MQMAFTLAPYNSSARDDLVAADFMPPGREAETHL
jgi:hypothetical protein